MLKIIEGGFGSVAYPEMKREIEELVQSGERVFLLVPEQHAVWAESELLKELPDSAALTFEVTNFTRLANTVYRALGGLAGEYADKAKEALIMWRTLTELSPFLGITGGRNEISRGVVEKALSAVAEMKSISALPEELSRLAELSEVKKNARLSGKLSDIAKIMTLYQRLLEEKYSSTGDECERLAERLKSCPDFFADTHIFVSGFTSFTEPQYKVLGELMRGAALTVHLTLPRARKDFFEFSEIRKTEERLKRLADKASVEKQILHKDAPKLGRNIFLDGVCDVLWRSTGKIDNDCLQNCDGSLRIFEAADPYEECNFLAADIKRRVMAGESLRDIAIITRDGERYAGILESSLTSAGIAHFISKRRDISSHEAIKLIYAAFSAVDSGFERESVISYAKCRLSGISAEACDEFELYCDTWQINGKRFTDDTPWNMSPDGYSNRKSKDGKDILLRINETRKALIEPLVAFSEDVTEAKTVRECARALVDFLTKIALEERIEERREELIALGELALAEENASLWRLICSALDSAVESLGDFEIDARGFESQLRVVLSEADIGRIPSHRDEVTVGSADMIRLSEKRHIYLLGVNQGEFPRAATESSYFSDKDKALLSSLGLLTDADGEIPYARELFFFSRAFSAASESVTLLYSTRNESFAAAARADIIDRITEICKKRVEVRKISELPPEEKLYFQDAALEYSADPVIKKALREAGYEREIRIAEGDISIGRLTLGDEVRRMMYPDGLALTQSRIDSFVGCPFAYYLRYNIKLSENGRAGFDARNIGTFIHAILESFFGELKESGEAAGELPSEKRADMVERAAKKYLNTLLDGEERASRRTEILLDRLCRAAMPVVDGLCDELRGCDFTPRFFELHIEDGDGELPSPATFVGGDGKKISVYGDIDRVDTFKSGDDVYVRVIDYKTGSKSFSPSDIDEGRNLQMFLYLKAICETGSEGFRERLGVGKGGRIIPAGVIYVKTDMSDVTVAHADGDVAEDAVRKNQKRHGMILDDPVSIAAMNKEFLPVKFKKDGSPDARSEKLLYTYDGWGELSEKISGKVREVSDLMRGGEISPTTKTKDTPCEYCSFKPICRKRI